MRGVVRLEVSPNQLFKASESIHHTDRLTERYE